MNTRVLFSSLLLVFFIGSLVPAEAQINVNKLKNKAKQKASEATSGNNSSSSSSNSGSSSGSSSGVATNKEYDTFVRTKATEADNILANQMYNWSPPTMENLIDQFYNQLKELDYPKTEAKLKEKGKLGVSGYHYDKVIAFRDGFTGDIDSKYVPKVNEFIEMAYKVKARNENEAIRYAKAAVKIADAVLLAMPEHEKMKNLKADANKTLNDIGGAYFAKVYTSDFHKENAGKILFSTNPIVVKKEDPTKHKNSFTANDYIYAMTYLDATMEDIGGGENPVGGYVVYVDGNESKTIQFKHNKEDVDQSWYRIDIRPHPDVAIHGLDPVEFAKVLSTLSPRKHTIKVEFVIGKYSSDVLASGEFELDWSGADADKVTADAEQASKNAQDNYARQMQLPQAFSQATQKFSDPGLSQANMKAVLQKNWSNCAQIMKVVVMGDGTADDWYIHKNNVDIPTKKTTLPNVVALYKGKDGWCYFVEEITFKRDYTGGGTYSDVKLSADSYHVKIDCKNIK